MKFSKLIFFFLYIFIFNSTISYGSIVYLNIDFVIKNSEIGKLSINKLESINQQNLETLKKNQLELKELENELKKKENIISKDEFNKELKILKIKFKEFSIEKEKMVQNFKKKESEEIGAILEKINVVIQEYMKQNSIEIVLDKKNIFVGKVSSDITEKILIQVNNKYK